MIWFAKSNPVWRRFLTGLNALQNRPQASEMSLCAAVSTAGRFNEVWYAGADDSSHEVVAIAVRVRICGLYGETSAHPSLAPLHRDHHIFMIK